MKASAHSNNLKKKPDNWNLQTQNLITFYSKPKRIIQICWNKWKPGNKQSLPQTKNWNSLMEKTKNYNKRLQKFKNNVKKPKPSTKICAKVLIQQFLEIKIYLQNWKTSKIHLGVLRANWINQSSKDKLWENNTSNWLTKTKFWTAKLISAC